MDGTIWLFSYGTLRQAEVQQAVFGRELAAAPDVLPGYRIEMLAIGDPGVVRTSGLAEHPILRETGAAADMVEGQALAIGPDDLPRADAYEVADYRRVEVTLLSGRRAFVYVG
ncbi:gamma-glutamylcyclotransferase family protein [Sphingomonas sp. DT-204]|uniref:gamma-glutamylcyclotransferase family protein n=1 Tax=Sphingomonas sp. DT-204 TaxID=3396166 RepID=UPI003F1DD6AA